MPGDKDLLSKDLIYEPGNKAGHTARLIPGVFVLGEITVQTI